MPLLGTEALLGQTIAQMILAEIAAIGGTPPSPEFISALGNGIAKALVPHILANLQVAPGLPTAGSPAAHVGVSPWPLI